MNESNQNEFEAVDGSKFLKTIRNYSFNSDSSDEFTTKNLSKRKDLENLLAKKFSPTCESDNLQTPNLDHDTFNQAYDNYNEEDGTNESFELEDNILFENNLHNGDIKNSNDSNMKQANHKDEETIHNPKSKISTNETDEGERDLKALNDYIRANCHFEFEKVSAYINCNSNTADEQAYSLAEIENHENIRAIVETCREKFPELKYKISKSVKSAFKEKFRTALKLYSATKLDPKSKAFSIKSNTTYESAYSSNRNISYKDLKSKTCQQLNEVTGISNNLSESTSPNDTCSQKYFPSHSSDMNKFAKRQKVHISNGDSSSDSQKATPPSIFNITQTEYNNAIGPIANIFTNSLTQSNASIALNLGLASSSADLNGRLKPQMFDNEFLRLAAANPLFKFSDFASMAATNPYLKNIFRSQNIVGLPSPTQSVLAMNSTPASSSSPFTSYPAVSPSMPSSLTSMAFTTNSLASTPVGKIQNSSHSNPNKYLPSSQQLMNKTSNPQNHYNQHGNDKQYSDNIDYKNNHNDQTKSSNSNPVYDENDKIKLTNALINGIEPYFSVSSKLKLSSKFSKLSSPEIQTIKSLIIGYRESAAFLSRSAEELEILINDSYELTE